MDFQTSDCFEIIKNRDFFKISNLQIFQISIQILTFLQDKSTILKTRSMRIPAPVLIKQEHPISARVYILHQIRPLNFKGIASP